MAMPSGTKMPTSRTGVSADGMKDAIPKAVVSADMRIAGPE